MTKIFFWFLVVISLFAALSDAVFEDKCKKADPHAFTIKSNSGYICVKNLEEIKIDFDDK
jgi:hypothetical protein